MIHVEPPLDPPEGEICKMVCEICGAQLDWEDKVFMVDGKLVGCENCIVEMTVDQYSCEFGIDETDWYADHQDHLYHEWKENR